MAFEQGPAFDAYATAASVAIRAKGRVLLIHAGTFTPSVEIAGHRWVDPLAPGDLPFTPELRDVLSGAVAVVG